MTSAMCSVACGSWSAGRDVERAQVRVHLLGVLVRHLGGGPLLRLGLPDDLVVDVGDVADEGDRQPRGAQVADDHVERHHHPRVADVAEVVDGDAAASRSRPAPASSGSNGTFFPARVS